MALFDSIAAAWDTTLGFVDDLVTTGEEQQTLDIQTQYGDVAYIDAQTNAAYAADATVWDENDTTQLITYAAVGIGAAIIITILYLIIKS